PADGTALPGAVRPGPGTAGGGAPARAGALSRRPAGGAGTAGSATVLADHRGRAGVDASPGPRDGLRQGPGPPREAGDAEFEAGIVPMGDARMAKVLWIAGGDAATGSTGRDAVDGAAGERLRGPRHQGERPQAARIELLLAVGAVHLRAAVARGTGHVPLPADGTGAVATHLPHAGGGNVPGRRHGRERAGVGSGRGRRRRRHTVLAILALC